MAGAESGLASSILPQSAPEQVNGYKDESVSPVERKQVDAIVDISDDAPDNLRQVLSHAALKSSKPKGTRLRIFAPVLGNRLRQDENKKSGLDNLQRIDITQSRWVPRAGDYRP